MLLGVFRAISRMTEKKEGPKTESSAAGFVGIGIMGLAMVRKVSNDSEIQTIGCCCPPVPQPNAAMNCRLKI